MEDKIPEIEEYARKNGTNILGLPMLNLSEAIEFAKLHVTAALKAASENFDDNTPYWGKEIKDRLLSAYPLDKIK